MSEPNTTAEQFDVFLCHNSEDKPAIRDFARRLEEHGTKPWLDEEQIRPGTSWQTALGEQIEHIKSAAVFVGESGLGPWQSQEIQALLSQFVNRNCPVIPVVLPTAQETPDLPWTLQNIHWVDFRTDHPDPMDQLIWGITGKKPGELPQETQPSASDLPVEAAELFPPQKKKIIEVRLPGSLDDFSDEEQRKLIQSLTSIMEIGDVKLTRAVAGSVRLYLELDPEDADKFHAAKQKGLLADLDIQEVRLYPALPDPPKADQRSQLLILLDRVKEYWIDGALKNSLYHEVLISLGKRAMDEAVEPPSKHYLEFTKQRQYLNLEDSSISTVFDATGLLLILGEPGSGKTTTMLDLASKLIARAKEDAKERVPIILNLSSWQKQSSLAEWIVEELSAKYRVPKKIGRRWLKNDYILPLLDGLDEVKTAEQANCVTAINKYIDRFHPSGLVVCCRLMEYQWLPERLKLNGAICLELLGSQEVDDFLTSGGQQLAGLRQAMQADPVLQELSQTPLMLSIMSLAFEGIGGDDLAKQEAGTAKERRTQIFNLYIDRMFQRKENIGTRFAKNKMVGWLAWLARGMKEHSQSVFVVEELQPSYLDNRTLRSMYGAVTALVISLFYAFGFTFYFLLIEGLTKGLSIGAGLVICNLFGIGMGCWSQSIIKRGLKCGFLGGVTGVLLGSLSSLISNVNITFIEYVNGCFVITLFCGLIGIVGTGSLSSICPVETLKWNWSLFWRKSAKGIIIAFIFTISIFLVQWIGDKSSNKLSTIFVYGLIAGIIGGIISGLLGVMGDALKPDKALPNQGISLSLKNAATSFLLILFILPVFGFIINYTWALVTGDHDHAVQFSIGGLFFGLIIGLILGVIVSLNRGGASTIKHYSLRLILWITGHTPFNFIKFLDHSAKLILLKKVGGGYMFIHRMLLEHFAEIEKTDPVNKKAPH